MADKNSEEYRRAERTVEKKMGFYRHLIIYLIINAILILVNIFTNPQNLWFYWVTIFWGIGLICHFLSVFTTTSKRISNWKEKEIEKELKK